MNNMEVERPSAGWKPNFGLGLKKLANAVTGSSTGAHCVNTSSMHCWQPVADASAVEDGPAPVCGSSALLGCTGMARVAPMPPRAYVGQPGCQGCATLQHRHEVEKAQLSSQLADAENRSTELKQQVHSLQKQLDELKAFAAPLLAVNCVMGSLPSMCPGLLTDNKNCLGSGSYGTAHEWSLQTDTVVVKEIHLKKSSMENVAYEVGLTSLINHPNVVKSLGWWMGGRTSKQADASVEACVLLMMERCEGSLADCLDQGLFHHTDSLQPKNVKELLDFAFGLCKAVGHIHELGIIHNDITVNNVFPKKCLQTGVTVAKLGDFGLSLPIPEGTYTGRSRGTPELSAPELLRDARCACHSRSSDVYSLGGTLWELFTCRPWRWLNNNNQFEVNALYPHVPAAPAGLSELIVHMMAPNPADRPTMSAVLSRMEQLLQQPIVPSRGPAFAQTPMPASVARPHRHHHAPADTTYTQPKRTAPAAPAVPAAGGASFLPSKRAAAMEDDLAAGRHGREPAAMPALLAQGKIMTAAAGLHAANHMSSNSSAHSDTDSPMADVADDDTPDFNLLCSQPSDASTGEFLSFAPPADGSHGSHHAQDRMYPQAGSRKHHSPSHPQHNHSAHSGHGGGHPAAHPWMAPPQAKSAAAGAPSSSSSPSKHPRVDSGAHTTSIYHMEGHLGEGGAMVHMAQQAGGDLSRSTDSTSSVVKMPAAEQLGGHHHSMAAHRPLDVSLPDMRPEGYSGDHLAGRGVDGRSPVPPTPTPQAGLSQFVNGSSCSDRSTNSSCPSRDMFTV